MAVRLFPWLSKAFNPGGNITDARRLAAIRLFDPVEARKLARQALNASHKDLATEAILTLKGSKKDIGFILEQTGRRSTDIRDAAFSALQGIMDKRVVSAVSAAFADGVKEAAMAIRCTPCAAYTAVCSSLLKSMDETAGKGKEFGAKEHLSLMALFRACAGQGSDEMDQWLAAWVQKAIDGFLDVHVYGYGATRILIESVAMSTCPSAQKLLVQNRDRFDGPRMTAIMCAASWHQEFDLVELFAPYIPNFQNRCYGWFCGCGGDWPCSLLSAVEFALDVDFEAPGYDGRKPHVLQIPLIKKIRKDPRWKVARRT